MTHNIQGTKMYARIVMLIDGFMSSDEKSYLHSSYSWISDMVSENRAIISSLCSTDFLFSSAFSMNR